MSGSVQLRVGHSRLGLAVGRIYSLARARAQAVGRRFFRGGESNPRRLRSPDAAGCPSCSPHIPFPPGCADRRPRRYVVFPGPLDVDTTTRTASTRTNAIHLPSSGQAPLGRTALLRSAAVRLVLLAPGQQPVRVLCPGGPGGSCWAVCGIWHTSISFSWFLVVADLHFAPFRNFAFLQLGDGLAKLRAGHAAMLTQSRPGCAVGMCVQRFGHGVQVLFKLRGLFPSPFGLSIVFGFRPNVTRRTNHHVPVTALWRVPAPLLDIEAPTGQSGPQNRLQRTTACAGHCCRGRTSRGG